jgi:hypothetical protein
MQVIEPFEDFGDVGRDELFVESAERLERLYK